MASRHATLAVLALGVLYVPAQADVFATITNGAISPSEGVLNGYFVQVEGMTICANPFVIGRHISCRESVTEQGTTFVAATYQQVWATTRGRLDTYLLWDDDSNLLCEGPIAWPQFRGPESYLTCD